MTWGDRVGEDPNWRNDRSNPVQEGWATQETHAGGVSAWAQGNIPERELMELGTARPDGRAN